MPDDLARERRTYVRLTRSRCTRTYGTAPCAAALGVTGARKCYGTFATCQHLDAFDPADVVYVFGENVSGHPKTGTIFPALLSVSERPVEINLSGIDPSTTALGKRARVTVVLQNFAYHDALTDPYHAERRSGAAQADGVGYDPARGTFFGKMDVRDPYFEGRKLEILRLLDGADPFTAPADATYEVTEWAGAGSDDRVTVTAQDPLNAIDGTRSMLPPPSTGQLLADMTLAATTLTLTPSGIGSEYEMAGLVAIGNEILAYLRYGDVLTVTQRGVEGTTAAAHQAGDTVQQVMVVEGRVSDAMIAVLTAADGPVDPALIDSAAWHAAHDMWMGGVQVRAVLWQPTSRATLAGELSQLGVVLHYDETGPVLDLIVNAPVGPGETYSDLTDDANLVRATPGRSRNQDGRISAVYFHHGMPDPTASATAASSYAAHHYEVDPSAASAREWGSERVQVIYSRWFGREGSSVVQVIAQRLVARFRNAPVRLTADVDAKDFAAVSPGRKVRVTSKYLEDDTGAPGTALFQISQRTPRGGRAGLQMESFNFDGRFAFLLDSGVIGAGDLDYDTAAPEHQEFGWYLLDETVSTTFPDGTGPYVLF